MKFKPAQTALALIVFLMAGTIFLSFRSFFSRSVKAGQIINSVFLVTSKDRGLRRINLLFFVNYLPKEGFLNLIPIPPETRVTLKNRKMVTLGGIFEAAYKNDRNIFIASNETKKAVEGLFDDRINIPYYAALDKTAFEKLIDLFGGIAIDVEEPIAKRGSSGSFTVLISSGRKLLDGRVAVDYLTVKNDLQDYGGALRSQIFLKSFLSKFSNPVFFLKSPKIISLLNRELKSNLKNWDYFFASFELKDLERSKIRTFQLPGVYKRAHYLPDFGSIKGLMNRMIPSTDVKVSQGPKVRLEVWNASGKNNLAEKITWILRAKGYDVVEWGTYSVRQKKTLIEDFSGDSKNAQNLAKIISCGEIVTKYDAKRYIDISVILGEDCKVE